MPLPKVIKKVFKEAGKFLGVFGKTPNQYFEEIKSRASLPVEEIERLIKEREDARKQKDFKRADAIRSGLMKQLIILEDPASGTKWTVKT